MSRLEKVSHISVIGVCLLIAYLVIDQKLISKNSGSPVPVPSSATGRKISEGKKIDIAGVDWAASKLHVAVAMTTHCKFCILSEPLYRRLSDFCKDRGEAMVFVSTEATGTVSGFLADQGIRARKVVSVSFDDLGVTGTPTLLLVDATGVVKKVYRGKLSPVHEDELFQNITNLL